MISLSLDHHDFLYAVEGFARGSHLRQHFWRDIVYKSIPQMSDDDLDYLWYFMRRDLFDCFFYELNGVRRTHVGHEDFLHALAALHRGNRYHVRFIAEADKKAHSALCYRFQNQYHPLFLTSGKDRSLQPYSAYIPTVKFAKLLPFPANRYVQAEHEHWWSNLDMYDDIVNV